jgi:hypothetical protein
MKYTSINSNSKSSPAGALVHSDMVMEQEQSTSSSGENSRRKWSKPVAEEYQRQNQLGRRRGKCRKCGIASASPSGSGFCSGCESKALKPGQHPAQIVICSECGAQPVVERPDDDSGVCPDCAKGMREKKRLCVPEL